MEPNAEQIKKALECCANNNCTQCHYHKQEDECVDLLAYNTLALINEQEQGIEELTKIAEFYRREAERNAECRIKSAE